jgi:lipopolysaccharide export system ATP-binding protein
MELPLSPAGDHTDHASQAPEAPLVSSGKRSEFRAENLKKSYKSRTVVHDVSLSVKSGEVVGLLGPNGAGKTTCFYMMVGLVPLDGGNIVPMSLTSARCPCTSERASA